MPQSSIGWLRLIGLLEGISLLVLMGIAMPLKYLADKSAMVTIVGWIHGLLFIIFMMAVLIIYRQRKWPFKKVIIAFIAAFLPFGTFIFDKHLRAEEDRMKRTIHNF